MVALARGHWQDLFRREFAAAIRLGMDEAPFVLEAHVCLAEASLAAADSESIARLARELLPLALEAGSTPGEALTSLLIGESSLFSGQLDESREWLSRAVDLYAEMGGDSGRAFALVRVAEVFTALGQRVEATRELTEARRLADRSELSSHLLVRVFAGMVQAADDRASVRRLLLEAEGTLRWKEVCGPCSIGFRVAAAIACARSADVGRSRRWLADAERLAGMWQGGPWQAAVWEARAELRLATRDRVQAAGLFREAADLFAECGRPLDGARCLAAAADLATVDPQA
jgi:tetratricopeptide (TPR) repeat protein